MSEEKVIKEKLAKFVEEMRPLDGEFAQILNDNLWDLYIQSGNAENLQSIDQFFDGADNPDEYIVTLHDWDNMQLNGDFIPDDGDAYYGTNACYSDIDAFRNDPPQWATHVILFGK